MGKTFKNRIRLAKMNQDEHLDAERNNGNAYK